ncbi:hypothetical protein SDC9_78059 [bioreactor metagenome]|jgi:uncharacterized membrane protein|uniref:Small integral membrane protein DUF2273 n=1 Tax=bioreactor metagenome TaxID=1076179 RepID=A0A644YZX8_9ZZZZ
MNGSFLEFIKEHKFTIILVLIGLILSILFFTIGFWKTILLMLILALCFFVGFLLDKGGLEGLKDFFNKLFTKNNKTV